MKIFLFIITGLLGSYYFTDLSSENSIHNLFLPIMVAVFVIALCIWFVIKTGPNKMDSSNTDTGFFDGFFGGGSDGD